ncbi:Zn-dependent hydrolase [Desulfosporosinus fructosivorans]|uniref:Zn-dependent hydrolase n=1 Tax=Desulfosporosinus fructosivorans TaxID=2018669 RepID=A0A4Z0R7G5_9FIRM|nr:Zn-dependent hydrolase [Desulfosporosinus fructosivorans]TGE39121.1 Zn-dependent hydrolase [Desulfosporosinus fructosivorans]
MINKERLFNRLMELGEIGKLATGGITRQVFTLEDISATTLVATYMREAGLSVRVDAVGNLIGRKEGLNTEASVVLTGSHIDTVHEGGAFDGSLGVLGGIEALQTMNEQGIQTEQPIEVIAYKDEEGCRFSFSMLGSRAIAGILKREDLQCLDRDGMSFAEALKMNGFVPDHFQQAARPLGSVKAHLELHVEQGKVLESKNLSVGVVTGINSSLWLKITLKGEAGHAGATPMGIRHDPLVAAAEIIQAVEEETLKTGTAVGTVGRIQVQPGGINIIPGSVEFTVDLRDLNQAVGERLEQTLLQRVAEVCQRRGIENVIEVLQRVPPVPCSEPIQEAIKQACRKVGKEIYSLPSGAGHDSMQIARLCPIGMIFVRSKDGISHNPAEWSSAEDCADGVNVLYHSLLSLANNEK